MKLRARGHRCHILCYLSTLSVGILSKKQTTLEFVTNTERIPKPSVFFLSRSDFFKNTNKNSVAILEKFLKQPALIIVHIIDAETPEQARPARPRSGLKMFLKPVWEVKMHGVRKIDIFHPLFCVRMLGKSTNYSTGTRRLCSTF